MAVSVPPPQSSPSSFDSIIKKKVLVVDDEDDIIFTIKNVLEENGLEVDSFNAASCALENFVPGLYNVAILDIKMPEMSGFELYERIMEMDNKVRIIFLTALAELRDYDRFRNRVFPKLGERHFVQKPIENRDLIKRVNLMAAMYSKIYYGATDA